MVLLILRLYVTVDRTKRQTASLQALHGPFLYVVQSVFPLPALYSLAIQGALLDVFLNGIVLGDVANPGELAPFHRSQHDSCFPARKSDCCLTHSFVLCLM